MLASQFPGKNTVHHVGPLQEAPGQSQTERDSRSVGKSLYCVFWRKGHVRQGKKT